MMSASSAEALRLALVGYGRMGRMIESLAAEAGCEVVVRFDERNNAGGAGLTAENLRDVDVAIDFSVPEAAADNACRLAELGVHVAVGATGWLDDLDRVRRVVDESGTGLVHGANFSIGVNAFYRIVAAAAGLLAADEDYDAFAYEAHHKKKVDAPSGTMLRLLDVMREAGYERPVDVGHNRAGFIPGTHVIGLDSEADTIELRHTARSRAGFARGALRAARWIHGRRGFYEFSNVWDQMI